jgi:hypothetical protein
MKRGQMQGEMFIYLMTILVIGLLLFLGIKWIVGLKDQQEIILRTQFKQGLENQFEQITYGSTQEMTLDVPATVGRMCFVETRKKITYQDKGLCMSGNADYDPLICNEWTDNSSAVIFSPALGIDVDIGVVGIDNAQGYLCYDTKNGKKITITITGMGTYVKVSDE